MKAKLCWFYGFKDYEVESMEIDTVNEYYSAMDLINAEDMMMRLHISDFPHLKKPKRSEVVKKLKSVIKENRPISDFEKTLTTQDLANQLATRMMSSG